MLATAHGHAAVWATTLGVVAIMGVRFGMIFLRRRARGRGMQGPPRW